VKLGTDIGCVIYSGKFCLFTPDIWGISLASEKWNAPMNMLQEKVALFLSDDNVLTAGTRTAIASAWLFFMNTN
jgi:hypothetical protein